MSLSDDELDLARELKSQMSRVSGFNARMEAYYEGSQRVQQLGVAIPPAFAQVRTIVGWPGLVVDGLEERLDCLGWAGGTEFGLDDVWASSLLGVETGMAHLDALIFGISYATLTGDDTGSIRVRAQSPRNATALHAADGRTLRAGAIFTPDPDNPDADEVELLLPDFTVQARRNGNAWRETYREPHSLGEPPMVALPNRRRTSRQNGRSEITRAVRGITDDGVRALLGMDINREFYSFPQRWAMGAAESEFVKEDGSPRPGWEIVMGAVWAIGKDDDGDKPEVGEFSPASPAPYVDQVKLLSQLMAAEGALPAHYFGFVTDVPASADAIRSAESRLVKRAERRQASFGHAWLSVGWMVARALGDAAPAKEFFKRVSMRWRDPATPTAAAAADAAMKLVSSGILPATSSVVLDMLGMDPETQKRVEADRALAGPSDMAALAAAMTRQG